jgi:glutamyl-tRNA reductase
VVNLTRHRARDIVVANRTPEPAERQADHYGVRTATHDTDDRELPGADIVVSCTGATGVVLPLTRVAESRAGAGVDLPMAVVDLALPHDVEPAVGDLPGIKLIGLARLAEELNEVDGAAGVTAVREIVAQEIAAFITARHTASVTPTVVALRTMATGVVDAEMERLLARLPDLDPQIRAEIELAVRRVADKLLHQPTVRVKELANEAGAVSYAAALAELFSLDPDAVDAVTRPEGVS